MKRSAKPVVLLVHQAFSTLDEGGGTRHCEFISEWLRRGWEVEVIASAQHYLSGEVRAGKFSKDRQPGLRIHRVPALVNHQASYMHRVVSYLWFCVVALVYVLRASKANVVVGTSPPIGQGMTALVAAKLSRCPFVLEVRDLWPDFPIALGGLNSRIGKAIAKAIERRLYSGAEKIVVNSPGFLDPIAEKGVSRDKLVLVPNGVDPSMFVGARHGMKLRVALGLDHKFVILYSGALGKANDLESLLEAALILKEVHEIRFVILGDGMMRRALQDRCSKMQLTNVQFLRSRKKRWMPDFLAAADLCYAGLLSCPILHSTYPNKVFDYMAAEKPVLLAIDGPIRKVVCESKGGVFVSPGQAEEIAAQILDLSLDLEQCRQMGRNGRAYVLEHFSRSNHAEEFHELLLMVTGTSGV